MYLTKNEIEIMDVLWMAGRPLTRGEILTRSEGKSWMDSSVHILLNSMLKKGAIREAGFVKCGKTCGRVYDAALSCAEYHMSTLESTRVQPTFPELLEAYIREVGLDINAIQAVEKILKLEKSRQKNLQT